MTLEATKTIENAFCIKIDKISQVRDGYYILCKDNSRYTLRPVKEPLERIYYTYTAVEHLRNNGFTKICFYKKTENQMPFIGINNYYYTLTPVIQGKEMSFENYRELASASSILAEMHIASEGFTEDYAADKLFPGFCMIDSMKPVECRDYKITSEKVVPWIRCSLGQTTNLYKRHLDELKRFKRLATRNRGIFDLEYLAICDYYIDIGEQVINELNDSTYTDLVEEARRIGYICHKDYTAHNILTGPCGDFIMNFDSCGIELPVYDISNFLRRKLRKSNWSVKDAEYILEKYNAVRSLSKEELHLLKLLLMYPQKLWRNVNKYYNSRKSWCEKGCLEKLREIEDEKEPLAKILDIFD